MRVISADIAYIRSLFAQEDDDLRRAALSLQSKFPQLYPIQIGAEEGRLLQIFIKLASVKTIVEIGSLAGYSTLWMAKALPDDGVIYAIESNSEHAALIRDNFAKSGLSNKLRLYEGKGNDILPALEQYAPFDMLFIDADKIGYPDYLSWADNNIKSGGLIIGDNSLLFGYASQDIPPSAASDISDDISSRHRPVPSDKAWRAMRRFNSNMADSTRYLATIITTQEGMTVAIKL